MPVVNLLTSAASFLYAVSSMLSGAQNNAGVGQSFVTNFQTTPNHFLPVGDPGAGAAVGRWRSSKSNNNYNELRSNTQLSGGGGGGDDLSNNLINNSNNASFYETYNNGGGSKNNNGQDPSISSTIFFPSKVGGGYGQSPPPSSLPSSDDGLPLADMAHPPIEISYHDGETLATLYTDEYGNVTRCEMLEVNKPSEQQEALANLAAQNKLVEKTNFNTMINIIRACQELDKDDGRSDGPTSFEAIVQKTNMWTIVSGILPGTKWCGVRDIADGWNDLGPEKGLDKCCRSHDLCPRKVLAFRAAYGLVNWSFYTKSHCECDAEFYDCLKQATPKHPTAELLGNFYFNVLRMQCIDEENPPRCISRSTETSQSCQRWADDYSRASQSLVFREFRQMWV